MLYRLSLYQTLIFQIYLCHQHRPESVLIYKISCLLFGYLSLITFSKAILNNKHANELPCLNPFIVFKDSDNSDCSFMWHRLFPMVILTSLISLLGKLNSFIVINSWFQFMLSYAVLKSMKRWWVSILYLPVFSRICRRVYIWSVVDFPCRKPHW
jgi:hypothetical protein